MTSVVIKHLLSGGIITNYSCSSRCAHCLYRCSPGRDKKFIDPKTCEHNLRLVRRFGCGAVHIGGGEPLLYPDELEKVFEIANQIGVSIEYVETNSSWFKDAESAKKILSRLRKRGLSTLLISISPFHNAFIPFSKVQGVMKICRDMGIHIFPWKPTFIEDLSMFDPDTPNSFSAFEEKLGKDYQVNVLQRYWIHMGGRALETFRPLMGNKSADQVLDEDKKSCSQSLSDTSHFHLDLYGNYIPGLCSGLYISPEDLGSSLPESKYPVITALARSGVKGLFNIARQKFGYVPRRSDYINKCDLCTEIRGSLVENGFELPELGPAEFYRES